MDMRITGYGYEWDAELIEGPGDGCVDRVIQLNNDVPPSIIMRIVDGQEIKRESLGEKLVEYFVKNNLDENQKVAVYELIHSENDFCKYKYLETISFDIYKKKYL